jgi:hypothetical protein
MSAGDNRAESNLLLLCIEHSYEVDEFPDSYPAEQLREWKQGQLDEYEQAQRGWALTDSQAGRVLEASAQAVEHHHAGAVLGTVRAVERLMLVARKVRTGPAKEAAEWEATRGRVRRSFVSWDEDGNTVHAEPSRSETRQHESALVAALEKAYGLVSQGADDAKVELAAVRASRPAVALWVDWVGRAVDEVAGASSKWPRTPNLDDDGLLEEALSSLAEAANALGSAWRGETATPPPPVRDPETVPEERDPLQEHRALLDKARPFARVGHRPYDAALRAQLAIAAEEAASIPPVLSAVAIDLSATCYLAAAVAGNATDDELAELMKQDSGRRPLSAAALLLAETARVATSRGRRDVLEEAESALVVLCDAVDWSDPDSWDSEDANGQSMFWAWSRATSTEHVSEKLAHALRVQPDLLPPMIAACAGWVETVDHVDMRTTGIRRRYKELPPWFPVEAVREATSAAAPELQPGRVDSYGGTAGDEPQDLLAQVLWLVGGGAAE